MGSGGIEEQDNVFKHADMQSLDNESRNQQHNTNIGTVTVRKSAFWSQMHCRIMFSSSGEVG